MTYKGPVDITPSDLRECLCVCVCVCVCVGDAGGQGQGLCLLENTGVRTLFVREHCSKDLVCQRTLEQGVSLLENTEVSS